MLPALLSPQSQVAKPTLCQATFAQFATISTLLAVVEQLALWVPQLLIVLHTQRTMPPHALLAVQATTSPTLLQLALQSQQQSQTA